MGEDKSLLGAVLVRMGAITLAALQQALDAQKQSGEQLGTTLIAMGVITEPQLDEALAKQAEMRV